MYRLYGVAACGLYSGVNWTSPGRQLSSSPTQRHSDKLNERYLLSSRGHAPESVTGVLTTPGETASYWNLSHSSASLPLCSWGFLWYIKSQRLVYTRVLLRFPTVVPYKYSTYVKTGHSLTSPTVPSVRTLTNPTAVDFQLTSKFSAKSRALKKRNTLPYNSITTVNSAVTTTKRFKIGNKVKLSNKRKLRHNLSIR